MSAAPTPQRPDPALRQRRAVRNVTLSCVAVLLLGQLLIAALCLAALLRLETESAADRVALLAGRAAGQVEAGLALGKPLTQYFGLGLVLDRVEQDLPGRVSAAIVLDDGTVLASTGPDIPMTGLLRELRRGAPRAHEASAGRLRVALPLAEPGGGQRGALVVEVPEEGLPDPGVLWRNLGVLALITGVAAVVMALALRWIPVYRLASASGVRLIIPLGVMLVAQGVYAAYTVQGFREVWQAVLQQNAVLIGEGLERDLERVLGYGIPPERMRGVDRPMARALHAFPLLGGMELVSPDGTVLATTGSTRHESTVLHFPLEVSGHGPVVASLRLFADDAAMGAAVRDRALDAATIAVVAMVAAIELMLMLQVLMDRAFSAGAGRAKAVVPLADGASPASGAGLSDARPFIGGDDAPLLPDDPARLGMVARPVMFSFLFAMALPLGFLPLYARSLVSAGVDAALAPMLIALPTATEMAAGLVTALWAGRLIDRKGWMTPVAWGLVLAVAGNLACALAGNLWALTGARALCGLGYGLVWMALQGFVVNLGPPAYRGRNMTALIAGLFAGHMTGAAVGGMLAGEVSQGVVFLVGAFMVLIAGVALRVLLWPYRGARGAAPVIAAPMLGGGTVALRRDVGYMALLLGSIVPFSIAQVGLLSYALPLYFDAHGAGTADVGRVIMLYGFCVIYLGPVLGRLSDGSKDWKRWIVAGGGVGSAGLVMLHWVPGLWGVTAAVLLLAIASCLAGAAQTPYMLARPAVQAYGAAGATGLMRGADKFGQMLGPLMVGALFAGVGMSAALVATGALYLLGTLMFWWLAPAGGRVRPE